MENEFCYVCYEEECINNKFLPKDICKCSQTNRIHEKCHLLLNNKYRCSICKTFYNNIKDIQTEDGLRVISGFDNLGFRYEYTINSDGKKHGYHKIWYHNGNIWEENHYIDGIREGVQKLYSFKGDIYREIQFSDGQRIDES